MAFPARVSLCLVAGAMAVGQSGCNMVPGQWLRQSQLQMRNLHGENQTLRAQNDALQQQQSASQQERDDLARRLELANQRFDNLQAERQQLSQKYVSLLDRNRQLENPLPQSANQKFAELARRFPGFNFDPETGVSKFSSDLLFDSGSARVKESARPLLQEFARIMNDGEAKRLHVLVVGHTDDKAISKPSTAQHHPTNWHLSTDRADEVVVQLGKFGLADNRMGAAGYSMHQPVVPNSNDANRSQNRRVEIFVLAPEATVAGWDPTESPGSTRTH